jgi:hypothetical protein
MNARPEVTGKAPPIGAYTLRGFADAHQISLSFVYKLLAQGKGPRVMRVGTRRLVSVEEAQKWRAALTDDAVA